MSDDEREVVDHIPWGGRLLPVYAEDVEVAEMLDLPVRTMVVARQPLPGWLFDDGSDA
jgi:hypothetical protein